MECACLSSPAPPSIGRCLFAAAAATHISFSKDTQNNTFAFVLSLMVRGTTGEEADIQSLKHVRRILRYCRDVINVSTAFVWFVGITSLPVQCLNSGLKIRKNKWKILTQPSNVWESYFRALEIGCLIGGLSLPAELLTSFRHFHVFRIRSIRAGRQARFLAGSWERWSSNDQFFLSCYKATWKHGCCNKSY